MRNAETVLAIIRDRGKRRLPLENVYRLLYNPDLYLRAYSRLYYKKGAMTPGTTPETVDDMAQGKIGQLIDDVRHERHQWKPVRRVYIPKSNGKKRPLGIPTWKDKLLQEVIRSVLEAYYEPQFSPHSHGFRHGYGCHTALWEIQHTWKGTRWFIEGDIAQCFDRIDHGVLLQILGEQIHDNRFLRLIRHLLENGYLEDWNYHPTLSGTPQGGVVSPILANIYLHRLDQFVEQTLMPEYNRGKKHRGNPPYKKLARRYPDLMREGRREEAKALRKQYQQLPALDPFDPGYRRLRFVRYADDFLLGFTGPRSEAEEIKQRLKDFLRETLKLELSAEKTLITHASTKHARFLGYEIGVMQANSKQTKGRRSINGSVELRVPSDVLKRQCDHYMADGKPIPRRTLKDDSDFSIIARYQAEYQGVVQYYKLAHNVGCLNKLRWVMETALLKTLACKYQSSVAKMKRRYASTVTGPDGVTRKCLMVQIDRDGKKPLVARFGGISLRRQPWAAIEDGYTRPRKMERTEILQRLLANECELCGSRENIRVHHIRKLADLKDKGGRQRPQWMEIMAARHRKSLVVCHACHVAIHAGKPTRQRDSE